jgi:hypothetical protein
MLTSSPSCPVVTMASSSDVEERGRLSEADISYRYPHVNQQ